jgi:flagellar motor switch/type III secretory pathway protein FliN
VIPVLGFERAAECAGSRVRRARFEHRSSLPVSAACVVANGAREALAAAYGTAVSLRLLEPAIPDEAAWAAIASQAEIFRLRGPIADAAFVLRPPDALALATAAFGEAGGELRPLSPIEREVLARVVRALGTTVAAVCGIRDPAPAERVAGVRGYATYFELIVEHPFAARVGVALSRDPAPERRGHLRAEDLLDVEIEVGVEFASGSIGAAGILGLRPGCEVVMDTKVGDLAMLKVAGAVVARGECGSIGGRSAMIVSAGPKGA